MRHLMIGDDFKSMIHKVDGNNYPVYTKQKSIDIPDTGEKFNLGSDRNSSPSETKAQREKEAADKGKQQAAERSGVRLELSSNGRMADAGRQKQQETAKAKASPEQQPLFETIRTFVISIVTAVQEFFSKIWNDQPPAEALQEVTEGTGTEDGEIIDAAENVGLSEISDAAENAGLSEIVDAMENGGVSEMAGAAENADMPGMIGAAESTRRPGTIDTSDIADVTESFDFGKNKEDSKSNASMEYIDTSDGDILDPVLEEERRNRKIRQSLQDGDMERVISLLTENGKRTIAKNSTLLTSYDKHGRVVEPNASDRERALHGDKNSWKL